jgi:hypothetical protein
LFQHISYSGDPLPSKIIKHLKSKFCGYFRILLIEILNPLAQPKDNITDKGLHFTQPLYLKTPT